jgi:hypothetical protein
MESLTNITRRFKQYISVLNFFEVETVYTENFNIRKAIISTRLYTELFY